MGAEHANTNLSHFSYIFKIYLGVLACHGRYHGDSEFLG